MALFNEKEMDKKSVPPTVPTKKKKEAEEDNIVKVQFSEKSMLVKKEQQIPSKKKKKQQKMKNEKKNKKNVKKGKKKEKTEKRPMAKKSIVEVLPIIDITDDGLIELKDEQGFFDIWQIKSKDVYAMNDEETQFDIYNLAYFFQAYQYPVKIVSLNFPVSTVRQQTFIQKKLEECKSSLYEKFLLQKLKELQFLEWGRTNREYFIFIYGANEYVVKERVESIKRHMKRSAPINPVETEKKVEILYKLYNQNSKLGNKK
ncbi:hypothetical protein AC623_20360 [Bacillus sp. FJAT-27231]|uniref:hypothetical protein n=1 Tax=Bacillus sp. FJAT-27231 TaxID=1679168 RepID=UPI000670B8A5|nr:hypothetical protein [Bacillus sp. FJAT-27231]KMY52498.1 hypothetical protein AC623_20360 [Bacillus sp. FJAT-27231]